jgi:hypothetical protein
VYMGGFEGSDRGLFAGSTTSGDRGGRAVKGIGLPLLDCWDRESNPA